MERLGLDQRRRRSRAPDDGWPEWLGRAGLVGRGLLFVVVGWLAIRLAFGDSTARADQSGALQATAQQPMGRFLVSALAALFAAYAIYRFAAAFRDPQNEGVASRLWCAWRGVFYAVLTFAAAQIALGTSSGSGDKTRDVTLRVFELPGGRWVIAAVGLGLVGSGMWNGWRVATGKIADDLKEDEMPDDVQRVVRTVGIVGTLGRMLSFVLVGWFLVRAGWRFDPTSPVGLDESLSTIRGGPWGQPALIVFGVGLIAFGLFALARSRYQRVWGA